MAITTDDLPDTKQTHMFSISYVPDIEEETVSHRIAR